MKALKDSPDAFCSTYESALQRDLHSWEEQLWSTTAGGDRNTQFAFEGDFCIGVAALYREPVTSSGDIIMMWVDPQYRGSNAASSLVSNLLGWAKDSGFDEVFLEVTDSNARAIKFYENMGFYDTGERVEIDSERNLTGIRMAQTLG
ncbi:MAG: GNAT family N-acetyltransferase [Verrucomicrobiales bacterium]|nr:GNAT family N-acetyltransferase [Verrucomicrobiales bacterium]